jgi:ubiquitin C-terminal hydrolase
LSPVELIQDGGSHHYQLKACVFHTGETVQTGHFYTVALRSETWWKLNDDERPVSMDPRSLSDEGQKAGPHVCLLFYELTKRVRPVEKYYGEDIFEPNYVVNDDRDGYEEF